MKLSHDFISVLSFFMRDEFGYWAMILSFGVGFGLIGSCLGIAIVAQFFKKPM